jgi:hypothetical protein
MIVSGDSTELPVCLAEIRDRHDWVARIDLHLAAQCVVQFAQLCTTQPKADGPAFVAAVRAAADQAGSRPEGHHHWYREPVLHRLCLDHVAERKRAINVAPHAIRNREVGTASEGEGKVAKFACLPLGIGELGQCLVVPVPSARLRSRRHQ